MRRGDWSDLHIDVLRKMAADGQPASIIGARLGRSRSAVTGKASRLGITLHGGDPVGAGFGKIRADIPKEAKRRKISADRLRKELISMGAEVYRDQYADEGSVL